MSSFKRILLCYDATPEGQAALRCGATLAKQLRADAHLVAIFNCALDTRIRRPVFGQFRRRRKVGARHSSKRSR
jgi:hypothetical protein